MQQLSYLNLYGETITFAGAPYVLCRVRGVGACDTDLDADASAHQPGELFSGARKAPRTVVATVHVVADARAALYRHRAELCRRLALDRAMSGDQRGRLFYRNDHGLWWTYAVPETLPDWGARVGNALPSAQLAFRCESPYWYGATQHLLRFAHRAAGLSFPLTMPLRLGARHFSGVVANAGHVAAPVAVAIAGHGETPVLRNESTGSEIRFLSPLPSGDALLIDTDPQCLSVRVRHADGAIDNGFGYLDPSASVAAFRLRPGENRITYAPGADTSRCEVTITWYDLFEGA